MSKWKSFISTATPMCAIGSIIQHIGKVATAAHPSSTTPTASAGKEVGDEDSTRLD
ncbi:MAG: hypothetical protein HDS62_08330 [Bacteroidales bacterium]|nr:hypothetical protein [Bacteroidales bacterium]